LVSIATIWAVVAEPWDREDGTSLNDFIGEGEVTTENVTLADYAEVVRIVGDGDIPDADKRTVASALGLYLADIGDSAVRQTSTDPPDGAAQDAEDFNRPDLVDFFQELSDDDEASRQVADSVIAWVNQLSEPWLADTDLEQSEVEAALDPVALVMGAIEDGFEDGDVERLVLDRLHEDLALAVAAQKGWPTPEPGEYASTLDEAFPEVGDPLEYLDLGATNEQRSREDDEHW
jgi:hypothetical protein